MRQIIRSMAFKSLVLSALLAFLGLGLFSCGGGNEEDNGDSAPKASEAQGAYQANASNGLFFFTIVLENNKYYILYGNTGNLSDGTFGMSGFMTGDGETNNKSFISRNLRDSFFNGDVSMIGTLNATFEPGERFNGSINGAIGQNNSTAVTFAGIKTNPNVYDYNRSADVKRIRGTWSMLGSMLLINENGNFTGTQSGCSFTGKVTPRSSGKNVYDASLTFGSSPCNFPLRKASGIALEFTPRNGIDQQLIITFAVENTNNSQLGFFSSDIRVNIAR